MKKIENLKSEELDTKSLMKVNGGNWIAFLAGAIVGGIIYDAYKAAADAYITGCMNGTIQDIPSSYRK